MKIFITGGAGFIGSHIVDCYVSNGHEVIVYDNFSSGKIEYLGNVINKIKIIKGDILDFDKLKKYCDKNVDVISHHAAQLEIFKCLENPVFDLKKNTIGTLNILELAKLKKISRVINASSACVYGQSTTKKQSEYTHKKKPHWPYGVSKLCAENYCDIYQDNYNIKITNLRYGIVFGEREWLGRVLTMFLSRALQNKAPVIFGNGRAVRDFIHVSDVAEINRLLLTKPNIRVLNVGTGKGTSIIKLANIICKILLKNTKPIFENVSEGDNSKEMPNRKRIPFELENMNLDMSLAKKLLNFTTKISLEEGIKSEFNWIKKNSKFWNFKEKINV
jgi:UDP-glucose 4-epimerase